jgi:hypothetical protein
MKWLNEDADTAGAAIKENIVETGEATPIQAG